MFSIFFVLLWWIHFVDFTTLKMLINFIVLFIYSFHTTILFWHSISTEHLTFFCYKMTSKLSHHSKWKGVKCDIKIPTFFLGFFSFWSYLPPLISPAVQWWSATTSMAVPQSENLYTGECRMYATDQKLRMRKSVRKRNIPRDQGKPLRPVRHNVMKSYFLEPNYEMWWFQYVCYWCCCCFFILEYSIHHKKLDRMTHPLINLRMT